MKNILLVILLSVSTLAVSAQSSLYPVTADLEALIQQVSTAPNKKETIKLNAQVSAELKAIFNRDVNAAELNANPFFQQINFEDDNSNIRMQVDNEVVALSNDVGNDEPASLSVTSVVNAVADLMIDRAKQELTLAFFNRLQTFSNKHPEFQTLFPKTFDAIRKLPTYSYPQLLPELRSAFTADLDQLSFNLEAVFELPQYKELIQKVPEVGMAVQTLKAYHDLENGTTPDKVLNEVSGAAVNITSQLTDPPLAFKNVAATLQFANIFCESLRDAGKTTVWITGTQAAALVSTPDMTDIYLGLLWQEITDKKLTYFILDKQFPTKAAPDVLVLGDLMKSQADNVLFWQNKITQFLSLTAKVEQAYDVINDKNNAEKVTADEYSNFIGTSIDAVDYTLSLVKSFDTRLADDDYLAVARDANSLYKDIYTKQYTQAVSDGLDMISSIDLLTGKDKKSQPMMDNVPASASQLSDLATKIKPYALFIANVAEAKSESDVESALNNAILPVGSSSIKKNTSNNLSIQSYVGAYYSFHNFTPNAIRAWSDKVGLYGPIGLSYTPGLCSWGKGGSLSLFASVFDLGAILDYKLKQDPSISTSTTSAGSSSATKEYSINLGQIFSPGVNLVYGFFENLPLSLGIGAQYGPGLSSISAAGATNVINPTWRFNVFLAVDLPFFNLVNQARPQSKMNVNTGN